MASMIKPCKCHPEFLINGGCIACDGSKVRNANREKTIRRNLNRRIPTQDDFNSFDGAHCGKIWLQLNESWCCPGCLRPKLELLRWTMLYPHRPYKHMGWAAGVHEHHDHGMDAFGGRFFCDSSYTPRFSPTVMCEQCNSADASAKKALGLKSVFSFSPTEISRFITPTPHGWHILHYSVAEGIHKSILPANTPY